MSWSSIRTGQNGRRAGSPGPATAGGWARRHRSSVQCRGRRNAVPRTAQRGTAERSARCREADGAFRSGLTRCWMVLGRDRVRGRSPIAISPMNKIALRLYPALIPRNMRHLGTVRHNRSSRQGAPTSGQAGIRTGRHPDRRTARGNPRAVRVTSTSEWIRSPCRHRRRARRGRGSSPASPRSRPRS